MLVIYIFLLLSLSPLSQAFLESGSSCLGKCNSRVDRSQSCQCNNACLKFNDCCSDYKMLCGSQVPDPKTCKPKSVADVSRDIWYDDVNSLPDSAFQVDYQGQVRFGSAVDHASKRLIKSLDETYLSSPTFKAFSKLLDNYYPNRGSTDILNSQEKQEVNLFLDEVLKTKVMGTLFEYFNCKDVVKTQSQFRQLLYTLWFQGYHRGGGSSSRPDSSGFEHVFVGEYKSGTEVNGFHGWLSFYMKEKTGAINYRGYVRKRSPNLIGASFTWKSHDKDMGSFMIGSSPEYDMAVFTLCAMSVHDNGGTCKANMGGNMITVKIHKISGHIASAYMNT